VDIERPCGLSACACCNDLAANGAMSRFIQSVSAWCGIGAPACAERHWGEQDGSLAPERLRPSDVRSALQSLERPEEAAAA
jgi:hypothetical protein